MPTVDGRPLQAGGPPPPADLAALETRPIKWMAGIAVAGGGLLFAALRTLG